jgi:hypothetical protein
MATKRVLLVDDEPLLLDTMAQLLVRRYEVTTAVGPIKGHELTTPLIHRLRSFRLGVGVVEPFRVLMPGDTEIRIAA